jgi:3',5'-cyclic AMP phosphodiesterase CpdA
MLGKADYAATERFQRVRLWAIADLHLAAEVNRLALAGLPAFPGDWLILAGDVCESLELFEQALRFLQTRFARIVWAPGNHELWLSDAAGPRSSVTKYEALVAVARNLDVLTPEDPFAAWPPTGDLIVPLCTLYDYSFRPADVAAENVVAWAAERRNVAADEYRIRSTPFPGMASWCAARCDWTEDRLSRELDPRARTILVGHWPLRQDLVRIPRIPRFTPWCGTTRTETWHRRYRARVVVSGHLHVRRTDILDGTRFEEASLGYPRQWNQAKGVAAYLRAIMLEA